jgi:4-amino-4-deoxy-L-arabinose transferase-like glycosyltransferase
MIDRALQPGARYTLILVVVGLMLFFWRLGGHDLWPSDEPRFALQAREMQTSGDYVVPTINAKEKTQKPPFLFWSMIAFSWITGDINEWSARLPSAVSAMLTLLLIYRLGVWLYDRRTGLLGALIFATSAQILVRARWAATDMLLNLFLLLAIVCLWGAATQRLAPLWATLAWGSMGIGILIKGPVGIVIPFLVVLPPLLLLRDWAGMKRLFPVTGIFLFLVVTLSWYVPLANRVGIDTVIARTFKESYTRNTDAWNFVHPFWYYVWRFPVGFIPWIVFLPWAIRDAFRDRENGDRWHAAVLLVSWFVTVFVFFSSASGKRGVYIIPLYAAVSLLIGALFVRATQDAALRRQLRIPCALWAVFTAVALIALPLGVRGRYPELVGLAVITGGILLAGGAATLILAWRGRSMVAAAILMGSMGLLSLFTTEWVVPWVNSYQNIKGFAEKVRAQLSPDIPFATAKEKKEAWVFYTRRFAEEVETQEEILEYLSRPGPRHLLIGEHDLEKVRKKLPPGVVEVVKDQLGGRGFYLLGVEPAEQPPPAPS